ncbi:MAG: OsmC family protein [bacterium]
MAKEMIAETRLDYDGEKTESFFGKRPPIELAGLSEMESKPLAWTPPHIYVAAIESCFLLTLLAVAGKMRMNIKSYSSEAEGKIVSSDGSHMEVSEVVIRPRVEIEGGADAGKTAKLFEMAKDYCLVARSVKTRIKIENP